MKPVFVITGVNKGLGRSLLDEALSRGHIVEGTSKSAKSENLPGKASFTMLDCSNAELTNNYWLALQKKYDNNQEIILINNAGTYFKKEFSQMDILLVDQLMRDNFLSAVMMTKGLISNFEHCRIVNIVSIVAQAPSANKAIYGAAKAAMSNFFGALRLETKNRHISIMNLYPHTINTWSDSKEPNATDRVDFAKWVIETSLLNSSFDITECTIIPRS